MTKSTKQWYASWFDSPYYHILYKDRDYSEAQGFMDNLTNYLNIPEGGKILDLATERKIITETEHDAIWEDNVIQWLCGDDEVAKQKLIDRITS